MRQSCLSRALVTARATAVATTVALGLSATHATAQDEGTRITLRVGPTGVDFAGFGGRFGAAVAEVSVARRFDANAGADLSAFSILPMGSASATPGCAAPIGSSCATRTSPNALNGFLVSPFAFVANSDLRVTTGIGMLAAAGGEGFASRSSVALAAGLDWVPDSRSRLVPSVGIRAVRLSTPIAGVRQLLLPGVGVSF